MEFFAVDNSSKKLVADVLVIPFLHDKKPRSALDIQGYKDVVPFARLAEFDAKEGSLLWIYGQRASARILLLGIGAQERLTVENIRRAYGCAIKSVKEKKLSSVAFLLPDPQVIDREFAIRAIVEALFFANYCIGTYKTNPEDVPASIQKVFFVGDDVYALLPVVQHTKVIMEANTFARDLVNGNADSVTPEYLAAMAKKTSKQYPAVQCTLYGKTWIEKQKMGLLLAVSRAAHHEPVCIILKYRGNPASKDHTVLVGKGITYDTGGLNLKPTGSIETMKNDMAGAAAVLATLRAVAALKLPINVSCIIPSCENAIGPKAYKPGDVYTSFTGKNIEITNTDAEGRLILADALGYAVKNLAPSRLIDIATLTGSAVVALGSEVSALFSNSDILAQELMHSGRRTFERLWQLPLYEEYRDCLKSDIADIKNAESRAGGAILAATFLHTFVGTIPWAHIDIAGTAFLKETKRYLTKYATGVGVRLLIDFLIENGKKDGAYRG